jgi:hypothetical protein
MGLSSNSIIHFTKNLSSLNGILMNNFKLKYCREIIHTNNDHYDLLVPMVSFCDIPFSQILNHKNNYGSYGIGLKKNWAEKKGLNPVLYVEKNSHLSNNFFEQLKLQIVSENKKISNFTKEQKYLFDVFRYLKNYQGNLNRTNKRVIPDYRFSDEREWRYVLSIESEHPLFGNMKNINNENISELKIKYNKFVENERLIFEPDDISYIIIKNESERNIVISKLETIKGKYPLDQVKRLTSRIISVEQIETDF